MRDLDELRHALVDETSGLRIDLPTDRIRRRARRVRARRTAMVATALVVALAIPAGVLAARPDRHTPDRGTAGPVCVTPGADGTVPWVGAPAEVLSGARFDGVGPHRVLVGVTNTAGAPVLTLVFHHEETGLDEYGFVSTLRRTPGGAFEAPDPAGGERRLVGVQVDYGGVLTIYLGLYAGLTDRVTLTTGQTSAEARTVVDREAGWTLFWLAREPSYEDVAVRIDALGDSGRAVDTAVATPGPDTPVKPSPTPPPLPTFSPTC